MRGEHLLRENRDEVIRRDLAAALVDHADAVAVAVEAEARVGPLGDDLRSQGLHVGGHLGIRNVIREVAIGLAEEGNDVESEPPEGLEDDRPHHAVAAVDRHLEPLAERESRHEIVEVASRYSSGSTRPVPVVEIAAARASTRSDRIASPQRLSVPRQSLRPLSDFGLWLPVTITPPSPGTRWSAW